jgi:hypothetical protein
MSRDLEPCPPGPSMVKAVDEMIRNLEQISADPSIVSKCPALPGIVLDKILSSCIDRDSPEYAQVARDYESLRADYLKALVMHPIGRALAALAVGSSGVELMERGRPPAVVVEARSTRAGRTRTRRESFNCHHIVPKCIRPHTDGIAVNHPTNFVVAKTTRRGLDQSENPHHFWHSLFLHPQTYNAPAEPHPVYVVRPLFPFYPPISQGFRSVEELRSKLAQLGAPPLPEVWENRILEFSKATEHKPYAVAKEFHEITRLFGDLFHSLNKDPEINRQLRANLAEKASRLAADFLPAGAYVNGKQLPPNHTVKTIIPIIESNQKVETAVRPSPVTRKRQPAKRKSRTVPNPQPLPQSNQQKV